MTAEFNQTIFPSPHPQINPSLPDADADCGKASSVIGKGGAAYKKHGAFCLETQKYADAVNHVSELTRRKSLAASISFCLLRSRPTSHQSSSTPAKCINTKPFTSSASRPLECRELRGIKPECNCNDDEERNKSRSLITINVFEIGGKGAFAPVELHHC